MHLILIRFAVVPQQRIFHGVKFSHLQQILTSNWISGLNAIKPVDAELTYRLRLVLLLHGQRRASPFNVVSFHLLATSTHVMLHKRYPRKYHHRLITFLFVQNASAYSLQLKNVFDSKIFWRSMIPNFLKDNRTNFPEH